MIVAHFEDGIDLLLRELSAQILLLTIYRLTWFGL
jgi:hypothetical protein